MFPTMKSFLIFFFIVLALIILGILFEEKLIAFEEHSKETALRILHNVRLVLGAVVKTIRDYSKGKEVAK